MTKTQCFAFLLLAASLAAQPVAPPAQPATPPAQPATPPAKPETSVLDDKSVQILATACQTGQGSCQITPANLAAIDADLRQPAGLSAAGLAAVRSMVEDVMKSDPRFGKSFGALVHLVRYGDVSASGDPAVERTQWLGCNRGGKDPTKPGAFSCGIDLRLYGRKNVAVIFVHTNVPAASADAFARQTAYFGVAKKKMPAPWENLLGLVKLAGGQAGAAALAPPVALLGFGFFHDMPVPSNLSVVGVRRFGSKVERIGEKAESLNEGLYFIDFTLGVPLSKLSATEFSATGQNFQPKTINRQSAYGMASLFFLPVDLTTGTRRYWMPRAVFGVGITGQLGHNYMIGGAMGPPELQFFVGSEFARKNMFQTNGTVKEQFRSRFVFGLNVPVKSAVDKLRARAAGN